MQLSNSATKYFVHMLKNTMNIPDFAAHVVEVEFSLNVFLVQSLLVLNSI